MGLTRSMLKGMGLTDEQIGAIIEEHINVVEGLKTEREKLKDKIDSLEELKEENKSLKEEIKSKDDYQSKYEKLDAEYNDFKKSLEEKNKVTQIKNSYAELLKKNNIADKYIDKILKVTNFDNLELDKNGKLKNENDINKSIQEEWDTFITTTKVSGIDVKTPPTTSSSSLTKEEILNIKDTSKRQKAIEENHELFGF